MNKLYFIQRRKRAKGKWRIYNVPSPELLLLVREVNDAMKVYCPGRRSPDRIAQSIKDQEAILKYPLCLHLDLKNALQSGHDIFLICLLVIQYPRTIRLVSKLFTIYRAPVYLASGSELKERKGKLKVGIFPSQLLLEAAFTFPLQVINRIGFAQVFIDDCVVYTRNRCWLTLSRVLLASWFFLLGFRFNSSKEQLIDLSSFPRKAGTRLSIEFGFRGKTLFTRVKSTTLNRYLKRLTRAARRGSLSDVEKILYLKEDESSFPLFSTFPKTIWSSPTQRQIFFSKIAFILKSHFFEFRNFNNKELFELLRGNL